jgi:hypothetical protein
VNSQARNGRKWKGCYYQKQNRKWFAAITVDGESCYLGSFQTEREAAACYNVTAAEWYGPHARLNDLTEEEM